MFAVESVLMTLILPTLLSFSGYYLKGTNCWEHIFSLNFFSRNILWQIYSKTGNPILQKISDREDFCRKATTGYENLKQTILD